MRALAEWLDEWWDVWTMIGALALAVVVGAGLAVAYNVTATRLETPAPTLESLPVAPSGSAPDVHHGTDVDDTSTSAA